ISPSIAARSTLSLHDALPIYSDLGHRRGTTSGADAADHSTSTIASCLPFTRTRVLCPSLGYVKIAQLLCRGGLHLGTTTIRRMRSEEHTSELQSRVDLVCRLL